jgi:sec-independent protein translocase protein TatC|tara:strand:- start:423 stop:1217 length:795 start_codon:yes stop_codon:yes gene_type:complete
MSDAKAYTGEQETQLPLMGHLIELRNRLLKAVLLVVLLFACMFPFANDFYLYLSIPLRSLLPEGSTMIATQVASPFLAPFKLTMVLALFIGMPFILHQAWSFIAPGLYKKEKRLAVPLLASSIILFYAGIAFAYYIVFPLIFGFFTATGPSEVAVMTDISAYLDFVLKLFFAFGVVFEIPIATILLIWSGATTADDLAKKRTYVLVSCFVIGMLITPPDVISQTLLAVPMWLLFEVGILVGRFVKPNTNDDAEEDEKDSADVEK